MREKKTISRSIRMTQTVYDIVNAYEGNGFNEKFENLVLYCFTEKGKIERKIKEVKRNLDFWTKKRTSELDELDRKITNKKDVVHKLEALNTKVEEITALIENLTDNHSN